MRLKPFVSLLCASLCVAAVATAQPAYKPAASRTLLRAGHVLDVHTGQEATGQTIIVEGARIKAIAATASTPAKPGDREVDLRASSTAPTSTRKTSPR